jgi:hypothetical protein
MITSVLDPRRTQRNAEILERAIHDAEHGAVDGVEAWRLPGGDIVAFPTPLVPFGQVRWLEKSFAPTSAG